jgi:hypothetical protein
MSHHDAAARSPPRCAPLVIKRLTSHTADLRRRFSGITDNAKARQCARSIAGWTPLPVPEPTPKVTRLRPDKG